MVAAVKSWSKGHPKTAGLVVVGLALALLLGVWLVTAQAAVERLVPVAPATGTDGWTLTGATSSWDALNDADPYDTTTYITAGAAGANVLVNMGDPVSVSGTINSVTAYARMTNPGGEGFRWVYNNGTLTTDGTTITPGNNYATLISFVIPAPVGGWTPAALQNLQVGFVSRANGQWGGGNTVNATQLYVEVDYTAPASLTVQQGSDAGRPSAKIYRARSAVNAVNELTFSSASGASTVTQIVVHGLDTANSMTTDVTQVRLFRDNGASPGQWDGTDTQIGTNQTFSTAQGDGTSVATFSGLTFTISDATTEKVWIVYTIGAAAVDGDIVGARVGSGDVTTGATKSFPTDPVVSANSGQTIQVDAAAPSAVNASVPANNAALTTSPYQVQGTASDAGSGVASVDLQIQRSDGQYWNGGGWVGGATWVAATGTNSWSYNWNLDANQQREYTYTITARATDGVGLTLTDSTPVTGVRVDNRKPAISSATAINANQVDVVFDEPIDVATLAVDGSDFTIAGLTVSAASLAADNVTVHLTTTAQAPGNAYTVSCGAGNIADPYGNTNNVTTANFTGYTPSITLTVAQGSDAGRPSAKIYRARGAVQAVDELTLTATGGTSTITQIVLRGLDSAATLRTDVSSVGLYEDDGNGTYGGGDTQIGTSQVFAGDASGSAATFSGLSYAIANGTTKKVWVVYTIGAGAVDGNAVGSRVTNGDITVSSGTVNAFANIDSANGGQTIQVDAAGPAVSISDPAGSAVLTGNSKTVQGTSSDTGGSGVSTVQIRIGRSDGQYWTGSGWGASTWIAATGTTTWSYIWSLDSGQNGTYTYTLTARATDNVGIVTTSADVSGVRVDNTGPSIASASAPSATQVSVVFGEALAPATVAADGSDFTIAGLTVSAAALQPGNTTVLLTTSSQTPGQSYTVQSAAGNVTDGYGNANGNTSANFNGFGSGPDVQAPTVPGDVNATSGTVTPTVARITWSASTDNVGVTGYRIWRSTTQSGVYSPIGTAAGLVFNDTTGVQGQSYWYKVSAYDAANNESAQSASDGPTGADWTPAPHATYSNTSNFCATCHTPHRAATEKRIFRQTGAATEGEIAVCYACHDGSGSSNNIKTGAADSFALASGHKLESADPATDLTNVCSSCHSPHKDYGARPKLPNVKVNNVTVTTADNSWCLACHNDANDWYGPAYPATKSPSRDSTGYPILGTFLGATTYNSDSANRHSRIPSSTADARVLGDCLYCHAAHRGTNGYDGLNLTYRPTTAATLADDQANGTYAASCFYCHGDVRPSEFTTSPANIKKYATNGNSSSGHRIKTAGGTLPLGAPLPCYDCHNPHGSKRTNSSLISDELGANLDTSSAAGVRAFCFSCHASSDAFVWDSTSTAYVAVGTAKIEGLRRDGSDGSALALPSTDGHAKDDAQTCYACHGDDYVNTTDNNVHNPGAGVSGGGVACYQCHGKYQTMEDGTAPKVGANRNDFYHHVLGGPYNNGAYSDGDYAPGAAGTYPTTGVSNIFCVTCHVDHDKFNSNKGSNLREQFPSFDGAGRNTDFDQTYMLGGLCTSCHGLMQAKDVNNQASTVTSSSTDGSVNTPAIGSGNYSVSAHTYKVESTFGDSTKFRADCSKCHNDEQGKDFQNAGPQFGTHFSGVRRLVSLFGVTLTDPAQEKHCYGCHSTPGAFAGAKTVAGKDSYGNAGASMDATAEAVYRQFNDLTGSKHPVVAASGNSVECENCHNPHNVRKTSRVSDPANTLNVLAYGTTAEKAAFCLKCHNGSAPAYTNAPGTYVPYGVTIAAGDAALMDKSTNAARAHWTAAGSITSPVACGSCHDNHASSVDKLLGTYDVASGQNRIVTTQITADDNTVCSACHASADSAYPSYVRDGSGYPTDGTWTGSSVYGGAGGIHKAGGGADPVQWPGGVWADGDCKNCHDVHGSANTYDELIGKFDPASAGNDKYGLCFTCHDGSPSTQDIKQFYPIGAGGTQTQIATSNFGHKVQTPGGTLAAGDALPCYDCHNPHGNANSVSGLLVVSQNNGSPVVIGDTAGEIDMSSAAGVRGFCFSCHTTSDNTSGWNGSGYSVVSGTANVEGIDRKVYDSTNERGLKLPPVTGHREGDTTYNCYTCHLSSYSAGGNNVHNPGPGISNGQIDCYTCHGAYQTYMEDGVGKTGASRATKYHHVLGSATNDGEKAFAPGSYPNSSTDVYCLSCHVDHDKFNSAKAANLRPDISTLNPSGASTDYDSTGNSGVCTACHASIATKQNPGTDQLNDGSTTTPKILPGGAANQYGASAHDYYAVSSFDAATFNGNCVKCHNDENSPAYKGNQTSATKFGPHWSAERRILAALGGALTDPLSETNCYGCHTGGTAGNDFYGVQAMTQAARSTQAQFALTYKHPVVAAGGNSVECVSCHNPHVVTSTTGKVTDPANTYNTIAYTSETDKAAFCLKCHSGSGSLPAYTVNGTTYVPSSVTIAGADAAIMNKSTNGARAHWSDGTAAGGSISAGEIKSCAQCHDNHGSSYAKLLGAYDPATTSNRIGGEAITGNDNSACDVAGCHAAASTGYPTTARDANDYPTNGTYPGPAVFGGANGIHKAGGGADLVQWPGSPYADGDCKNCHDVHGATNTYDELRSPDAAQSFSKTRLTLCFNCHDGAPSTQNISRYYPTTNGGGASQTAATNFGHKIQTPGGLITAGDGLPCYDCHDPHGSGSVSGLLVITRNSNTSYAIGDAAGEITMSSTAGERQFCFLCHTTGDATAQGTDPTDGVGYVNITTGGTSMIEGIDRTVYDSVNKRGLKLPPVNGHYAADTAQTCYSCHGNDYGGASSNNVHNPGPGVSNGGINCLNCHGASSSERYDRMLSDTGYYHHVLDNATPGQGPNAGAYPTDPLALACVSCHTDHNYFNANKASNLRQGIGLAGSAVSNTDFLSASPYGICLSCHTTARTKSVSQKTANASAQTPALSGPNYDVSAHDYVYGTTYGDSTTFNANCSKCHDDEQDSLKTYQQAGNAYKIGTHYSAEARIAKALGAAFTGIGTVTEENLCYRCHSGAGPNDAYGVQAMSANARGIQTQVAKTSKHDVGNATWSGRHKADEYLNAPASISSGTGSDGWWGATNSGLHVECEDCHNPHEATVSSYTFPDGNTTADSKFRQANTAVAVSGANKGTWGVDVSGSSAGKWTGSGSYGAPGAITYNKIATVTYEWQLCLKCHSVYAWGRNTAPAVPSGQIKATAAGGSTNAAGNLTDVGADFNPMQFAYHPLFTQGRNQPSPTIQHYLSGATSTNKWDNDSLRRRINGTTTGWGLSNTFVDGWLSTSLVTCSDCHNNDDWATTAPSGPHGSTQKWILRTANTGIKVTDSTGTTRNPNSGATGVTLNNFCINCHRADVYGLGDNSFPGYGNDPNLGRFSHNGGDGMNANCGSAGAPSLYNVGCYNCHGSRANDNATTSSGALHGSSMGRGDGDNSAKTGGGAVQNGTLQGDEMGKHFMNGASWDYHQLGATGGAVVGCSTVNDADTYGNCTNHGGINAKTGQSHWTYN